MIFLKPKYIFRIDDVCPEMNWENFNVLIKVFLHYGVKPIIGVIPDNCDGKLNHGVNDENFWETIKDLEKRGWFVAQHGYQHVYENNDGGLLNINKKSEFAGLPFEKQYRKIKLGREIIREKLGHYPQWWMAPAHSFDAVTCKVLLDLGFKYITDGIGLYPFLAHGLVWLPQQLWRPRRKLFGVWTICLHPNTLSTKETNRLEKFIQKNLSACQSEIPLTPGSGIVNRFFRIIWYAEYYIYSHVSKIH